MNSHLTTLLVTLGLLTSACAKKEQGNDRLKEKAQIEEDQRAEAERKVREARVREMETDLRKQYRFIKGIDFDYEGQVTLSGEQFKVRLTLAPSINIVETDRVRTIEEVSNDLNNLFINAQWVMSTGSEDTGAWGCNYITIKPNLAQGRVTLIADDCPYRINIRLSDSPTPQGQLDTISSQLSQRLMKSEITKIDFLHVNAQSIHLASPFIVNLRRTTE